MKVNIMEGHGKIFQHPIHCDSIDGLRSLACLGIIMMHIQANTSYALKGNFIFDVFVPSLTWLVYLFLMISGFGMCAGYLKKFQNGTVDLEEFYRKRYTKILPFFGFLLFIAFVMEHNLQAVYEISVEILLLHGLLPNNAVSVVGVCWTLGVIFLFYLLFPVFSVLLKCKKRAWTGLIISLWVAFVCDKYFFSDYFVTESFSPRHSFIYCIPFFICGGMIYLYNEQICAICNRYRWFVLGLCFTALVNWYIVPGGSMVFYMKSILLFSLWLFYAVGVNSIFLSSKVMKFFSDMSMEMYLAQMVIFRLVERIGLLYLFGDRGIGGWLSFFTTFILVIIGLIVFIICFRYIYKIIIIKGKKIKGSTA